MRYLLGLILVAMSMCACVSHHNAPMMQTIVGGSSQQSFGFKEAHLTVADTVAHVDYVVSNCIDDSEETVIKIELCDGDGRLIGKSFSFVHLPAASDTHKSGNFIIPKSAGKLTAKLTSSTLVGLRVDSLIIWDSLSPDLR